MIDHDLVIMINSQKCPSLARSSSLARARSLISACTEEIDPWHRKGKKEGGGGGYEENIGPYSLREYSLCILERV